MEGEDGRGLFLPLQGSKGLDKGSLAPLMSDSPSSTDRLMEVFALHRAPILALLPALTFRISGSRDLRDI